MPLDPAPTDACAADPRHVAASGEALRAVLRGIASPVVVVTVGTDEGPRGATIGSFASVSLDPPLVSFNVTHETRLHDALVASDALSVHFLSADQADVAARFAVPDLSGADQLEPFAHTVTPGGTVRLDGVLATLDGVVSARVEAGDHTLVVTAVTAIVPGRDAEPLLYFDQTYRGIGGLVEAAPGIAPPS